MKKTKQRGGKGRVLKKRVDSVEKQKSEQKAQRMVLAGTKESSQG